MNKISQEELNKAIAMERKRLLDLKLKKEQHLKENELLYFKPNKKQLEFLNSHDKKRRAGFCGNRFGKSTIGVVEDCCWALGFRPMFPEGDERRYAGIPEHGIKGLIIAEDWDKVKEIFTNYEGPGAEMNGKIFKLLPGWAIEKTHKNQQGIIDTVIVRSEVHGRLRRSTLVFDTVQSFKKNPRALESSDWDFIHLDEPIPQDMWKAMSRGLVDRGGYSWWLMTPLSEVWMYNYIVDNAAKDPNNFWYFTADMADNPLNSPEEIEMFLSQLTPDERDARQKGLPLAFGNIVYSTYDETKHLLKGCPNGWTNPYTPPLDYMLALAIDTHPQTPHAVLFIAISPNGHIHIYDECFQKGNLAALSDAIHEKTQGRQCAYYLCEPAAWNEDQTTGRCYADSLWEHGIPVTKASKDKSHGIILTKEFFNRKGNEGENLIHVHEHVGRFRFEIRNYAYDKENKPMDKDDHIMECLYRLVVHDNLIYHSPLVSSEPIKNYNNLVQFDTSLPEVPELVM